MNKEHFLIELKLHLRQLSLVDQQAILTKYDDLFTEKMAQGLTEYQITKELDSPKEIAVAILNEFNLELVDAPKENNDWVEMTEKGNPHPYFEEKKSYQEPSSGFIRFFQVAGIICLNLFFMFWLIFSWAIGLFVGWVVSLSFIFSPILGAFSLMSLTTSYGFFQLFISLLLCGIGLIGLLIMTPFSKVSLKLLGVYTKWNIQVLRGERAL
ncbi:DUF1700 domain-containing protein [Vagococcus sp. DIV0080]|uniref:DUF1700 domain-containing protein n=1 Tax=Candidatus Vagococcus giribetii TaxID=2230876 RepID=A0ABS3HQL0_9ENTE|nr:DUF1700 domain-containing protein [Vagococcus sp. DIV0080]MBO0476038.1 DUF1700 domain-containing protein [Vagococcus sp. DIV0080]